MFKQKHKKVLSVETWSPHSLCQVVATAIKVLDETFYRVSGSTDSTQLAANESPRNSLYSLTLRKDGQVHFYSTDTDWQ